MPVVIQVFGGRLWLAGSLCCAVTIEFNSFLRSVLIWYLAGWQLVFFILLLLKHLNSPIWAALLCIFFPSFEVSLSAVDFDMKLRGLLVSTSHCSFILPEWVFVQKSPMLDLLFLLTFVSVQFFNENFAVPVLHHFTYVACAFWIYWFVFCRVCASCLWCFIFWSCVDFSYSSCVVLVVVVLVRVLWFPVLCSISVLCSLWCAGWHLCFAHFGTVTYFLADSAYLLFCRACV